MRALLFFALAACSTGEPGDLTGQVIVDGDSDASGVTVRAVGKVTATTTTDGDGNYRLLALPAGDYALLFTARDTLEENQVVRLTVGDSARAAPEVHFTAAGSITGQVTLDGAAGAGVTLFVDGTSAVAASDAAGRYRLDKVPTGARVVEAVATGYRPGSLPALTVARGQPTAAPPLDLAVDGDAPYPVAALSGVAQRIDRSDHSGTLVTATRGATVLTTTTASDGSYHFDGIPTGLYRLDFSYDGHAESIPQVLALAGSTGQIVDGALYPLEPNPLMLPVARRLTSDWDLFQILDEQTALVTQPTAGDPTRQSLARLSLTSGQITPLADDAKNGSAIAVSSDQTQAIYVAGAGYYAGALRRVDLASGTLSTLADQSEDNNFQFTHDGTRVVFRGAGNLESVPTSGGAPVLLATGGSYGQILAGDQRVIYQTCDNYGKCTISVRAIDASTPAIDLFTQSSQLYVSPDGAHAAALTNYDSYAGTGQLVVAATDGSGMRSLWSGVVNASAVIFSPDGRYLAFVTDSNNLQLLDLTSSAAPAIVSSSSSLIFYPAFSADGTRLVYGNDWQSTPATFTLEQQPAGGGTELALGTRVKAFVLSADGTHTLFVDSLDVASGRGTLEVADASGKVTTLASDVGGTRFTPDGSRVIFETPDPASDQLALLFTVGLDGSGMAQLGEVAASYNADSPAGSWVTWVGPDKLLRASPAKGGTAQPVGFGYGEWASDSRLLVLQPTGTPPFSNQRGIYVIDVMP